MGSEMCIRDRLLLYFSEISRIKIIYIHQAGRANKKHSRKQSKVTINLSEKQQQSPKKKVSVQHQTTTTPIKLKKQSFILKDNIVLHEVVGIGLFLV